MEPGQYRLSRWQPECLLEVLDTMPVALNELIYIMIGVIPASAAIRLIICIVKINTDPDQAKQYVTRLKNLVGFVIISECALVFLLQIYFIFAT